MADSKIDKSLDIVNALKNFGIEISKIKEIISSTIIKYEIVPIAGTKISELKGLEDDLAAALSLDNVRIVGPISGKILIEMPKEKATIFEMADALSDPAFTGSSADLPIILGKDTDDKLKVVDLTKLPHLLLAGSTGQGKSVCLNALVVSLIKKKSPKDLKFVMIDPKRVELSIYSQLTNYLAHFPHIGSSIVTDTSKAVEILEAICNEMDDRYELLKDARVRNIKEYNQKHINNELDVNIGHSYLNYIVLVIDEFADLVMTHKDVEPLIIRLAQLARAVGIHMVVATQRPSADVITGLIKANFPARIAFKVTSSINSRIILDASGAEKLRGNGDMIFTDGNELTRIQGPFISTKNVENIVDEMEKI